MNNSASLDSFEDVADSTDWLSTPLSGLAAVEATLRCQVCKDFYKTPMLTSCNHTFCSICIRRALSNDGKCPLCRVSEQEMKLRSNWSMEEVVVAFTKTRSDVLRFAKTSQDTIAEPGKRKLGDTEDEDSSSQRMGKRLRSSTRLSKSRSMEMTSEMARLEADVPYQEPTDFEPDDGLVACPICLQRMKPLQVDRHLDTSCPGEPQPERTPSKPSSRSTSIPNAFSSSSSPKKAPARTFERLPAINYSMLKEPQLRKKLQEQGISAAGSRQMLEKRHKEWTTIWNANCDSQYPRRKGELLHDLDVWERTVGSRAPTNSRTISLGAQIRDKDFDGAAWAAKHDSSFKDLIANARRNKVLMGRKSSQDEKRVDGTSNTSNDKGYEPTPQPDSEMIASLNHSEKPQEQVDSVTQATGIIDLTGEIASSNASVAELSDREDGGVDLDASSRTTMI
ncbi:DNA repair protein rad18 [Daldinia caldariorum]|uniref:DNA repair protein rad18 n=1 Tax=Daldinia caldariorum TaxID=326644 RepID=UPI002008D019|nr:DNA repair protein rad18 [Daldinia caldariorum]KAI1463029.1 DNA repair protein rad18 [Daldinia caldariorum]